MSNDASESDLPPAQSQPAPENNVAAPKPLQPWASLSVEEKVERLREIMHEIAGSHGLLDVQVQNLQGLLANHHHETDGRIFTKIPIYDLRPGQAMGTPQVDQSWRTNPNALW